MRPVQSAYRVVPDEAEVCAVRRNELCNALLFGAIQAAAAFLAYWWWNHVPPTGYAVAVIAVIAAIMSIQGEMRGWQKAIWMLIIGAVLLVEFHAIRKDRLDEANSFSAIGDGIKATIQQSQKQFEATISKFGEAIKTETGGDSICYLDFEPVLNNMAALTAVRIGKYPLRNVNANILDRAKIQAAINAYVKSRTPDKVDVQEMGKISESLDNYRQRVGDFATTSRFIGGYQMTESDNQSFDILFGSFNAEWIERIELRRIGGKWLKAIMIEPPGKSPCFKIDPNWPRRNGELDLHNWPRPVKGKPFWERSNSSYCFTQQK